ncbi:hypothetical protein OXB_0334 [Bacillus sp. OxB-1]|uniref:DUF3048 domain-containing protein n=1 Tax=Bacillus sp. (strain OxB-1) TaxID=98228 RepID=UPI000581D54A|nr:DUF3048 domain-containing protein [Bacillus sp. OxB-1]BAQ08806.1 hypothetical protein OXB_0334 [Bacillus sp. OxB-1]
MKGIMRAWPFLLASILLLCTACSKKEKVEAEVIPLPSPSADQEIVEENEPVPQYPQPFTGILSDAENTRRPVLATINNHPLARPQSGISQADIVYEMAAEGNVTRFLALFQSELPEEIGPVRSARDYFVHIAKGIDAFYVAHGYSPDAQTLLQNRTVDHINGMQYDGVLFQRSKERRAPHNSYISGENVLAGAEKVNASMEMEKQPSLSFHESIENAKIGDMASTITVRYGADPNFTSVYTYDAEKGIYERTVNGILTVDKANGEQVELSNILLFEAAHRTIDNVGRQAIDINSGGRALLFHAGIVKEIEWKNENGFLTPVEDGLQAKLIPGKSWIHIVASNPGMATSVTYTP